MKGMKYIWQKKIKLNDWIINCDFFCYSKMYNIQTGNRNTRLHPDYKDEPDYKYIMHDELYDIIHIVHPFATEFNAANKV